MKEKKTYILFAALFIGITVYTVYIHNMMNKEVRLKGVITTTTTQSETNVTQKDDDKDKENVKDTDKDTSSAVTTVPTDEPEVTTTAPQFPMDINYATFEALICVPNIGEKMAESILAFIREKGVISDMDMLLEINGIGEAKLNDLKRYFYVSDVFTVTATGTTTTTAKTSDTTSKTTSKSTTTPKQTTTVSKTTTPKETKPPKTTTVTATTPAPVRTKVNINTASADELMTCLLIDRTQAEDIVAMRETIGGYSNILEILYCESISDSLYTEIDEFLEI